MDLDPGEGSEPYHYVYGREEWLLVLAGAPTLRHPQGEDQLEAGDLVCLPEGPAGAHRLLNRGESVVRALFLSTTGLPANVCYPDTGRWLIRNGLRARVSWFAKPVSLIQNTTGYRVTPRRAAPHRWR